MTNTNDLAATGAELSDADLAAALAEAAGQVLAGLQQDRSEGLGARGDAGSQQVIARVLAATRPGDAVLSEEAVDDPVRLTADRVWIVDPLDGTREYAEGRADWAVHVALWERGVLTVGAVALPGLATTLVSSPAAVVPPRTSGAAIRIAVSRTRPPAVAQRVAEALAAELVPMGSAGFKAAAVVRGEVDAYVHAGGQYEWDSAAPVAVALAAGLHASRLDGSPLLYNRPDPLLPDLVVCRPELAQQVLAAIAAHAGAVA